MILTYTSEDCEIVYNESQTELVKKLKDSYGPKRFKYRMEPYVLPLFC